MGSSPHSSPPAHDRRRSAPRILFLALLAAGAVIPSGAHSKPASVEPLDAVFQMGASGSIEASLNPPIQGVLRIIVRAKPQQGGSAGDRPPQSERQALTLEVTQWDRPIPFRLVSQSGHHHLLGGRSSLLVADIDVNDLTPGVPVRVRVYSNLPSSSSSAPPNLEARAYAVVY